MLSEWKQHLKFRFWEYFNNSMTIVHVFVLWKQILLSKVSPTSPQQLLPKISGQKVNSVYLRNTAKDINS